MVNFLLIVACSGAKGESTPTSTDSLQTDSTTETGDTEDTSDTSTTTDTGDTEVPLTGLCEDATRWGHFGAENLEGYGYISGSASNGVVPATILTNVMSAGGCTIWKRENPHCEPACDADHVCDFDGSCIAYPESQDLGTVTADGFLKAVSMTPHSPGNTYYDTTLPNPPWAPGALLTLQTAGANPVTLHGIGPVPIVPASIEWLLARDTNFTLAWDAPTEAVRSEIVVNLKIDLHGITPSQLVCQFPDTGTAEIPADALNALMDLGVTGFPEGEILRRTADHAAFGAGCMEFEVNSSRALTVSISGYTPCNSQRDCPDGTVCNVALQRCE